MTGATSALERRRARFRLASSALFVPFGLLHVLQPEKFLPIMPPWVPRPRDVVIATGVAEIAGGIGLFLPATRKAAGIGLALYAIGVWPANLHHAMSRRHVPPIPDSWWYHGPRLLAQPLFVWWGLFVAGVAHPPRPPARAAS